jgi:soluble cytochrome b562
LQKSEAQMGRSMTDLRKKAEANKKIQDNLNRMKTHASRISQLENQKKMQVMTTDQQIKNEKTRYDQLSKEIEQLKKLL